MKPDIDFFILCENVITDEFKKISIINIYDAIYATELPAVHQNLHFIARMTFKAPMQDKLSVDYYLSIKGPNGLERLVDPVPFNNELFKGQKNLIINIHIPAAIFDEFGSYTAALVMNKKEVAKKEFEVKKGTAEDAKNSTTE